MSPSQKLAKAADLLENLAEASGLNEEVDAGLDSTFYLTGTYAGDKEHQTQVAQSVRDLRALAENFQS